MTEANYLKTFIAGEKIKANETNSNNQYLLNKISDSSTELMNYVQTQLATTLNKINNIIKVGVPQIALDGILPTNCVWYEGAEVSRETYSALFAIFGETYGAGNGITTFNLPNFTGRVMWGATDYGYIEAGLPNITGRCDGEGQSPYITASGAFKLTYKGDGRTKIEGGGAYYYDFDASRSSSVYGKSNTVQPSAIKVRVYGRYQ